MDCNPEDPHARDILINGIPLDLNGTYELATNNYIANGGSGFEVLERNTTQFDTGISIRDVVKVMFIEYGELPTRQKHMRRRWSHQPGLLIMTTILFALLGCR